MSQSDYLRHHTDAELLAVVEELQERAEEFDARARQAVNDELRRVKQRLKVVFTIPLWMARKIIPDLAAGQLPLTPAAVVDIPTGNIL